VLVPLCQQSGMGQLHTIAHWNTRCVGKKAKTHCKNVSLEMLFGRNGNSYTVYTQSYIYIQSGPKVGIQYIGYLYIYIYIYIFFTI
jgi:hypothetical protein